MRKIYADRRRVLLEEIDREFGSTDKIIGSSAGVHRALLPGDRVRDGLVAQEAIKRKLWVSALSLSYIGPVVCQGLVLGFWQSACQTRYQTLWPCSKKSYPHGDDFGGDWGQQIADQLHGEVRTLQLTNAPSAPRLHPGKIESTNCVLMFSLPVYARHAVTGTSSIRIEFSEMGNH